MPLQRLIECPCGGDGFGDGCTFVSMGYPWCRSCEEHHRSPECPIDSEGRSLAPCGCPWDQHDCDDEGVTLPCGAAIDPTKLAHGEPDSHGGTP